MSIFNHFKHITITNDQKQVLQKIERFLQDDTDIFILKGYAGTGKTTLLKGIVDYLASDKNFHNGQDVNKKVEKSIYQLMAPTGRATKVIQDKTGYSATTVHKGIYNFNELKIKEEDKDTGDESSYKYYYDLSFNSAINAVYIIDEASMVSNKHNEDLFFRFGSGRLLNDLISYAGYHLPDKHTKIIFVGDPAQLPPVGMNFSPALDKSYIKTEFHLKVDEYEMEEVVRQDAESELLERATSLRNNLISGGYKKVDFRQNDKDISNISITKFYENYKDISIKHKIVITHKNKTAFNLNQLIRNKRFNNITGELMPIQPKDIIIVGANNYWHNLMNGEFGIVLEANQFPIKKGIPLNTKKGKKAFVELQWRKIKLLFDNNKTVETYILENFLTGKTSGLTDNEKQAIYVEAKNRIKKNYPKIHVKSKEFKEKLKTDPYFNALQIKYGYAITCHKSQGGEWKNVFIDFRDYNKGLRNNDFYKWAYTAITRSNDRIIAIEPPYFHSFSEMTWVPVDIQKTFEDTFGKKQIDIKFNYLHQKKIEELNIEQEHPSIQNYAVRLWESVKPAQIDLVYFDKLNFELRFGFQRGKKRANFKFWINKKNEIKTSFQKINKRTNSDELFEKISTLIKDLNHINIIRDVEKTNNQQEKMVSKISIKVSVLKKLYNNLQNLLLKNIKIYKIEHHNYLERYYVKRNNEKAIIDFQYNGDGFFGNVRPLQSHCNSKLLLHDIEQIVNKLKQ